MPAPSIAHATPPPLPGSSPRRAVARPASTASSDRLSPLARTTWAFVASGSLLVLLIAAYLKPSGRGIGTHTQLGLWPCGWLAAWGKPCPSCGFTTAFAFAGHGDLLSAFKVQPFGALLAILTAAAFWVGLYASATGSGAVMLLTKLLSPRLLWAFAAFWGLSWAYKVLTYSP